MLNLPKLDRIDIKILAELQRSGRMTNADLADKVEQLEAAVEAHRDDERELVPGRAGDQPPRGLERAAPGGGPRRGP